MNTVYIIYQLGSKNLYIDFSCIFKEKDRFQIQPISWKMEMIFTKCFFMFFLLGVLTNIYLAGASRGVMFEMEKTRTISVQKVLCPPSCPWSDVINECGCLSKEELKVIENNETIETHQDQVPCPHGGCIVGDECIICPEKTTDGGGLNEVDFVYENLENYKIESNTTTLCQSCFRMK